MVDSTNITQQYFRLLNLLNIEVSENEQITDFVNYLQKNESLFLNPKGRDDYQFLLEIVASINRYSDEFAFSDKNNTKIKSYFYELYDDISLITKT